MVDMPLDLMLEFVDFDSQTNVFTWKFRDRKWFTSDRIFKCWNSRWVGKKLFTCYNQGYLVSYILDYRVLEHRAIWAMHNGDWPTQVIDHINGDRSDNRIENLREASMSNNQHNRPIQKNNTSGFKGVHFHKVTGKWRASIWKDSKQTRLGLFSTPETAHEAYKSACEVMHGSFSNFG